MDNCRTVPAQLGQPAVSVENSRSGELTRAQHQAKLDDPLVIGYPLPVLERKSRRRNQQLDERLLAHELEIARQIQQSLLPKRFPAVPGLGLAGFCQSAREVGGDFFDVLLPTAETVLLVIADVMGKGVPAALFAATLRTLIRTTTEWTQCPAEILARINRLLFEELSAVDMFITAQVVLVEVGPPRQLTIGNAGHCPLLLTNKRGQSSAISPNGLPLGILPNVTFIDQIIPLKDWRRVLLYTDGVTEARNEFDEPFGYERLVQWLNKTVSTSWPASQLAEAFGAQLTSFQGDAPRSDDQTFLLLSAEAE